MDVFLGKIISPAIDMIDLISARGNTSLESAVSLTKELRWEIQSLGQRLSAAAAVDERARSGNLKAPEKAQHDQELKKVVQSIKRLLNRIEDAVPLINLAIAASGANLSSSLPSTVSPSRLLQASTFLTAGDSQYSLTPSQPVQIGPTFVLSLYMLFLGHMRPQNEEDIRESTWKEVIHKANVKLMRVPINDLYAIPGEKPSTQTNGEPKKTPNSFDGGYFSSEEVEAGASEYAYQLLITEDLDDDRVHDFEDYEAQPGHYLDVEMAGIREALPIHELSKIFYADTGKILNIGSEGENNSPVLLLKRDVNAPPPRRMMDHYGDENTSEWGNANDSSVVELVEGNSPDVRNLQLSRVENSEGNHSAPSTPSRRQVDRVIPSSPWSIPPDLDPEWLAFEVYAETPDSDDEESEPSVPSKQSRSAGTRPSRASSLEPSAAAALSRLSFHTPPSSPRLPSSGSGNNHPHHLPPIRTSLSLLEMLLRLLSLQQFQQTPHLAIPDEFLNFFLSESASTTGAAKGDIEERKRLRDEARRRVGFDPYDESPIKRRGEEYQYQHQNPIAEEGEEDRREEGLWDEERPGSEANRRFRTPEYARYDEGYDTRAMSYPSPAASYEARSSPLLLKEQRSRSGTPRSEGERRVVRGGRVTTPPVIWKGPRVVNERAKAGSPLARPGTGMTDEGLGSSAVSEVVEEKRGE
ncbi:MAG: hypothetical protein LQ342_007357 [Letrouitia transgressa]|nr:MAG: hypothetical protein LQ342_007357 [Letrouitia transgressa]